MKLSWAWLSLFLLSGASADADTDTDGVLSLDYCADQYVLALVSEENILALSPASRSSYSYYRDRAAGFAQIKPEIEAVYSMAPNIIVRQWGGGLEATEYLSKIGLKVVQIGYGESFKEAGENLVKFGKEIDREDRANRLIPVSYTHLRAHETSP